MKAGPGRAGPDDDLAPAVAEQRTSRVELLWPPSIRSRVTACAAAHVVSINEVVIQCIEVGLANPVVHELLRAASRSRRPNRRYTRGKESVPRAA
jgi:hypothetical protein